MILNDEELAQRQLRERDAYAMVGFTEAVEAAVMQEHNNHVQMMIDLYSMMIDPCADGTMKESEMFKVLMTAAREHREFAHDRDTYVQEKVDRAVLAEHDNLCIPCFNAVIAKAESHRCGRGLELVAANRAKVNP